MTSAQHKRLKKRHGDKENATKFDEERLKASCRRNAPLVLLTRQDNVKASSSRVETPSTRRTRNVKRKCYKLRDTDDEDEHEDNEDDDDDFKRASSDSERESSPFLPAEKPKVFTLKDSKKTPKRTPRKPKIVKKAVKAAKVKKRPPISTFANPIREAQARLHVSAVPDSLPCREAEFAEVFAFAEAKLQNGDDDGDASSGGCMYISGVPGTGKTATVKEVVRALKDDAGFDFDFVEINGMRLTEPNQAYVSLWKALSGGQKVTAAHAQELLEKRFSSSSSKKTKTTVLLVDELDMLWNRKQTVLYNLFDWPTRPNARLVVLAIANTMDLPEKMMMNRVTSRLGLTRLQFSPYTHAQLQEIVATRLAGLNVFDEDAVLLVARKVASMSGDARRALDICRRATEIAQRNGSDLVSNADVMRAHEEMSSSPAIVAVKACSDAEKCFLKAVLHNFTRAGIEETTFDLVYQDFITLVETDGQMGKANSSLAHSVCASLASSRIILAESGRLGPRRRIRLNVSPEDVVFAFQDK